jgi:hypothetical protein
MADLLLGPTAFAVDVWRLPGSCSCKNTSLRLSLWTAAL